MEKFDSIIIGSGVGGLAAGICLARAGKKVLILEQHYVPGGWSHSFTLGGQRFSPGVHYVGQVDKGESTDILYRGLGIANDIVFFRMNPEGYEHCIIGNERFDIPQGVENLKDKLSDRFPSEAKKIRDYLGLIQKVHTELMKIPKLKGWWQKITVPFRTKHFGKTALFSVKRVLGWYVKDPLAAAILNIQCGDHGLAPNRACFPVHASVLAHYFEGGFYPMGGGGGIVKAMTNAFKRHGGIIKISQSVAKIVIENKKAVGVKLADGTEISADIIVSNADPSITYLNLIGKENLSKKLLEKLEKTTYSVTSLILFLTVDMDVTKYGIDSGNIWLMRNPDIDASFDELMAADVEEGTDFPAVFVSCTTMKDPASFNGRYHNFEVVTYINYDNLKDFGTAEDYHSPEYLEFKQKATDKMLNTLEKVIPDVRQHIVQAELGTPKTNEFYINSTKGNVYGTEKTLKNVGPFAYKVGSEIENLYLCGASTLSHGVAGATYSGVNAASAILKCHPDDLMIEDENQQLRIYDADNPQTWPDWIHVKRSDKIRTFKEIKPA
ncbi:phytoene desaturase family protein [Flavobacterium silvaticum]|uniref:NAD(P)/FAD-dependent oxidoreductase n=1 Tax=Flavobacterium silvaticum TaxID=1852020 RepID=A0A972JFZ8_9FLAO|nr:NAD(P)/FAD-dependent oxidoreductase [Flavobacterium silvaticum]NMH27686.1 NAD(P)/FAD-dependent oxidoreductase [Flavobacterium silvaticum]